MRRPQILGEENAVYPDKVTPYTENDTKSPVIMPKVSHTESPLRGVPR